MVRVKGFATITLALLMGLSGAGLLVFAGPRLLGFHPPDIQPVEVYCPAHTKPIPAGKPLRIMSWNIQFLAGSFYPFWEEDRETPLTKAELSTNLEKIVNVIREVDPDILQLQEVHLTHPITFHQNQLNLLYEKLADRLPCYSHASYWKARFIPQKKLMGNIDMQLMTMSRYKMDEAIQKLLPATRKKRAYIPFYPRHSLLEVRMPLDRGGSLNAINTHLDSPGIDRGNMYAQVDAVQNRLEVLTEKKRLWFISGDFNLVPPNFFHKLPENQKSYYSEVSLLIPFFQKFRGIPELSEIQGPNWKNWLTAYDLNRGYLDLIIDYIFRPDYIGSINTKVLHLPLDISDHMPVITELTLPSEIPL